MWNSDEVFKVKDPVGAAKGLLAASRSATDPAAQAMARGARLGSTIRKNKEARAERKKEEAKNAIVGQRKAEYAGKGVA